MRPLDPQALLDGWTARFGGAAAQEVLPASLPAGWLAAVTHGRVLLAPAFDALPAPRARFVLAHEWVHLQQQAAGEVGVAGHDALEREADQVAERLVAGEPPPAEASVRWRGAGRSPTPALQPKVNVRSATQSDTGYLSYEKCIDGLAALGRSSGHTHAWSQLKEPERKRALALLKDWCGAPRHPGIPRKSVNLQFNTWDELARALLGSVRSRDSQVYEAAMARDVLHSEHMRLWLRVYLAGVHHLLTQTPLIEDDKRDALRRDMKAERGRYSWYYAKRMQTSRGLWNAIKSTGGMKVKQLAPLAADLGMVLRDYFDDDEMWRGFRDQHSTDPVVQAFMAARRNHWGVNESSDWVKAARQNQFVLGAGPSATTLTTLAVAAFLFKAAPSVFNPNFEGEVMESLAWGLFAFWNDIDNTALGTYRGTVHTFHEVMMVAQKYGVTYRSDRYPDSIPPNVSYS